MWLQQMCCIRAWVSVICLIVLSSCIETYQDIQNVITPTTSSTPQNTFSSTPTETNTPTLPPTPTTTPTVQIISTITETQRKRSTLGWLTIGSYGGYPDAIDIIHTSGKGWRNIFGDYSHPQYPSWSPNGQWIAFTMSREDGLGSDIFIMRPDGSSLQRLTNTIGDKTSFSWSPDGKNIVYSQTTGESLEAEVDLFVVNIDSYIISQLTDTPRFYEHSPSYSPQGDKIAFILIREDYPIYIRNLMIMNLDGYKPRKIIDEPISGFTWSPDGNHIVIVSANDCEDLYIINIDGSGIRQLTDRPGSEISPAWSPDGKWIAFMGTDTCGGGAISWEIFLIQPDGSGLIQLTNNPHRHPVSPSWSPLPALSIRRNFTITESGDLLNLRKIPSMNGEVLDQLNEGEEILVLEGPVEEDEYLWWKVRVIGSSLLGWVAENPGWFDGEW